jgi:nucleoside-diphosphate-sugar epimerase
VTSADFSKARDTFGYQPAVAPAEGLAAQVDWVLAARMQDAA